MWKLNCMIYIYSASEIYTVQQYHNYTLTITKNEQLLLNYTNIINVVVKHCKVMGS